MKHTLVLTFLLIPFWVNAATFKGSKRADVLRVIDGDTFVAKIEIEKGYGVEISVRIKGIDTPECSGECEKERQMAYEAESLLKKTLTPKVILKNLKDEKYGRVLADVFLENGEEVSKKLLQSPLVRPYKGKRRLPWC